MCGVTNLRRIPASFKIVVKTYVMETGRLMNAANNQKRMGTGVARKGIIKWQGGQFTSSGVEARGRGRATVKRNKKLA